MNLHSLVRGPIGMVNRDQSFTLYRSKGTFTRNADLETVPDVYAGETVKGQIQSLAADAIVKTERITLASTVRKLYLYAAHDASARPWGAWRPLARTGDYVDDELGNRWQVDAVLEDFSAEGWVSLQIILQTTPQALNIEQETDDDDTGD